MTFESSLAQGGRTLESDNGPRNFKMGWHKSSTDQINGIFLCTFDKDVLEATQLLQEASDFGLTDKCHQMTLTNLHTTISLDKMMHVRIAQDLFEHVVGAPSEDLALYALSPHAVKSKIKAFIGGNREMLPASIREVISPCLKPPEDLPRPRRNRGFMRIGLVLLLIVGVAYVVKKSFTQSKPTPPKTPPTIPTKPKTTPSIPAKPPLATPPIIEPKSSRHWGPVGSSAK
jgi:hypothetical protein